MTRSETTPDREPMTEAGRALLALLSPAYDWRPLVLAIETEAAALPSTTEPILVEFDRRIEANAQLPSLAGYEFLVADLRDALDARLGEPLR